MALFWSQLELLVSGKGSAPGLFSQKPSLQLPHCQNTCHVNSMQYMSCFPIHDVDSLQFYSKSIILNCQRGTRLCFTFCVLQSIDYEVFLFGLSSSKLPSSSAALYSSLSRLSTRESVWVRQKCKVKVPLSLIRSK